jgi:hypothetical protein
MIVTLKYIDNTGTAQQKDYDVALCSGIDDADSVDFFPASDLTRLINGDYYNLPLQAFNRSPRLDFGIIPVKADRIFVFNFYFQKNASSVHENYLIYNGETIQVEFDRRALQFNWINNIYYQKSLVIDFKEKTARTTAPSSWS